MQSVVDRNVVMRGMTVLSPRIALRRFEGKYSVFKVAKFGSGTC